MTTTGPRRQSVAPVAILAVLVVVTAGTLGGVAAQDGPGEPHNFYGGVANDAGEPAPDGVEIFAVIDGEVQDSIVVDESGRYGGEGAFDDKLAVDDGAGDRVVFTVRSPDGPEALESPYDLSQAGGVTELDLTFPAGAFVEEPADFQVAIDEAASTLDAEAGDDLTVAATVENLGDVAGTQTVTASVANDTVGDETVALDAGANATASVTFEADPAYDGETVEIASENDSATATLSVSESAGTGGADTGSGTGGDGTGSDTDGDDTGGDDTGGDDTGADTDGDDAGGDDGSDDAGSGSGDDGGSDDADDDGGDGGDDDDGDDGGDDDGTPGFGVLIAAGAVLGSALFLRRRQ